MHFFLMYRHYLLPNPAFSLSHLCNIIYLQKKQKKPTLYVLALCFYLWICIIRINSILLNKILEATEYNLTSQICCKSHNAIIDCSVRCSSSTVNVHRLRMGLHHSYPNQSLLVLNNNFMEVSEFRDP